MMSSINFFFVVVSIYIREVKGTHLDKAWSPECDPWNFGKDIEDADYKTCPPELRSPSGCGDFRDDPRVENCSESLAFKYGCSRRIIHQMEEPPVNQPDLGIVPGNNSHMHACIDEIINYEVQRYALPVSAGMHRERWPLYGEYEYLPMQRWVHSLEHGTVAFLYDHCMSREEVCKLKSYILSFQDDSTGPFRWILSPGPLNRISSGTINRRIAIVVWGYAFITDCWNPQDWDTFIERNYRWTSPEDWADDGKYAHGYMGKNQCEGTPEFKRDYLVRPKTNHGENTCPSLICLLISAFGSLIHFMHM